MSRWFRMYNEALDDPKVQSLCPADFKGWVNILLLACRHDGALPDVPQISFALRLNLSTTRALLKTLVDRGLIDLSSETDGFGAPHGWNDRQYKSDVSTGRVKRFRERAKTVSETPPETETETEKKRGALTRGTRLPEDFIMPDPWIEWAMEERAFPRKDVETEAASFIDYWHAKAGAGAVKKDWRATWQVWFRRAHERRPARQSYDMGMPC